MTDVYITNISKFLPNEPVYNDEMEEYLGRIRGFKSKSKAIVLRHNGIKCRYYAIDKNGDITHTNAELTAEAIRRLETDKFKTENIQLLTAGTASPDQLMPSHACMVHGELGIKPVDAMGASGSCNSSMWALNYAWMALALEKYENAVCAGSELQSTSMLSKNFEEESKYLEALNNNPYIAFEKEFLRWMLSDGAAALLLQNKPSDDGISLRIDWIEIRSYANEMETCMYYGGIKDAEGKITPWRELDPQEWIDKSVFSLKQDSRLLEKHITKLGGIFLKELLHKYSIDPSKINYFLPHISSEFFRKKIKESMIELNIIIDDEKWFTNLDKIGNIGAASGFLMLEELFSSGKLKKDETLLMMIPESARFSYTYMHITVV
ncbi:MAG: beta-ketoacyl-ACP synthase III [Bacteroidales bacterium]|nr:beta-ketoacyl-ACP synthase III [Bacteroidales bacterium]